MKTTNYILELLIAGLGAVLWVVVLIATLVCFPLTQLWELLKQISTTQIILVTPFVYVMGVLINHLVDTIYDTLFIVSRKEADETKNEGKEKFGVRKYLQINYNTGFSKDHKGLSKGQYNHLRVKVQLKEYMKEEFDFRRIKIRLCRTWAMNGLFIGFAIYLNAIFLGKLNGLFLSQ